MCVCVDAHLQLHVHTAGQALPGHVFYGLTRQTIPVARILHRLEEFTLRERRQTMEEQREKERKRDRRRERDRERETRGETKRKKTNVNRKL